MIMRLIRVYSFPILLLLLFVTVGWDCNVVTSSDVQNNDDDTAATSTILEMQYIAARIRPSAAPFTKFPSTKASTEYPTNTPTTPYPTVSSYELYEIGIWPTRAPATPNPTTRYPTMYPTTINEEAYEITFTGTTDQEYMSVLPLNTFDVSIAVYEDLIPSSYINMPAFSLLNQETLIQDGWDVSQGILNQISYDSDKKIRVYRTSNGILAPGTIGLHQFQWSNGIIGSKTFTIEVTCSDGIKCNGDERYVYYRDPLTNYLNARCQGSPKPLCNDGNDCTADTCDEETGKCSFQRDSLLSTSECPLCSTEKCTPNCARKFCGPDSCGGSCGSDCTGTDEYCVVGKCQALAGEKGVCGRPYDLTKEFTSKKFKGIFDYTGNTAKGFSILRTYCNYQSESKELIYMFKMPQNSDYTGIDARVVPTTASGSANPVIQLIEVNPEEFPNPADGCLAVNTRRDLSAACNRKSTPPGNGGSRITWALKPGFVYYIQVESYWPGENNEGKFDLTIALTPGCTMQCDHKICGDSGCGKGFPCELNKALPSDSVCDESDERTRLLKKTCKPNCKKKQCGDDGCGGTCGECDSSKGDVCSTTLGKCVTVGTCNHYKPRCTYKEKIKGKKMTIEGCPENSFCGVDCTCYDIDDFYNLPDLYVSDFMMSDVEIQDDYEVSPSSCAYNEGCFATTGKRRIYRFPTLIANQGRKDFVAASPPQSRPDIYIWGACHGHWHFDGFAEFKLLSSDRKNIIVEGGKRSFCAEDSIQLLEFPSAPCLPSYSCFKQGVSVGWTDVYGKHLDCQFIDITDVVPGDYVLKQCTNILRTYEELSRANNCMYYPVTIPDPSETRTKSPTGK